MNTLLSFAMASAFFMIVSVDAQSNVTARVLDGSIFPLVEQAQTQTRNGVKETHVQAATANKIYLRRHCDLHLKTLGQGSTACGYRK